MSLVQEQERFDTRIYIHYQNRAAKCSMQIILNAAQSMLVNSGLLTRYWPKIV